MKFKLTIKPCWVKKLYFKKTMDFIFYTMGDDARNNVAKYELVQQPFCGHPVTVDASALDSIPGIVHNPSTQDFSVAKMSVANGPSLLKTVNIKAYIDCVAT